MPAKTACLFCGAAAARFLLIGKQTSPRRTESPKNKSRIALRGGADYDKIKFTNFPFILSAPAVPVRIPVGRAATQIFWRKGSEPLGQACTEAGTEKAFPARGAKTALRQQEKNLCRQDRAARIFCFAFSRFFDGRLRYSICPRAAQPNRPHGVYRVFQLFLCG